MNNLYEANNQWQTRPDDERFASIDDLLLHTQQMARAAVVANVQREALTVANIDDNLKLVGPAGKPATLTHFAFGQLSRFVGAPSDYLRSLDADLAANNINHGLAKLDPQSVNLLLHKAESGLAVRSVVTQSYDRVWNHQLVAAAKRHMVPEGWVVPAARPARAGQVGTRAATAADVLPNQGDFGLAIKEGDLIAPAGLYASDHDMFMFLVNHVNPVNDGVKLLNRGMFLKNSEVGDGSLVLKLFLYDNVCGNHIVWGVSKTAEIRVRHIKARSAVAGKTLDNAMAQWETVSKVMDSTGDIENAIKAAKTKVIAATRDEVIDSLFAFARNKQLTSLTKKTLDAAYTVAEQTPRYGNPNTVWAMVNGLTEYSQTGSLYTDDRNELDTQAGRLMEIAF